MAEELAEEVLHVAATRPALLWGIPFEVAMLIIVVAGIAGVLHVAGPLVGPPLWILAAIMVRRDYNAPRILFLWWDTSVMCPDTHIWNGSSAAPFPLRLPKRLRGIRHAGR